MNWIKHYLHQWSTFAIEEMLLSSSDCDNEYTVEKKLYVKWKWKKREKEELYGKWNMESEKNDKNQ